jgi:hypothetical protein
VFVLFGDKQFIDEYKRGGIDGREVTDINLE